MADYLYCHPEVLEEVKKVIKKEAEANTFSCFSRFNDWYGYRIITNELIPKYQYKVLENRFYKYWDGKGEPPSWCLYFGFVKPEYVIYKITEAHGAVTLNKKQGFNIYAIPNN